MSFRVNQHVFPEQGIRRTEERYQTKKLQRMTMASSRKSAPEKKSEEKRKKPSKGNTNSTKRRKDDKNKTSNGGDVPATPSSRSDSQCDVENGVEITQKTTGGKNPQQKAKRERKKGKEEKEDAMMNKFPMERVRRIIRSEDSGMRITNEAVFLVNKATEKFLEKFCEEAYKGLVQDRKKSLGYKHL
ncbi:uncharacterized protein LOC112095187, partial [Morus notabilis]